MPTWKQVLKSWTPGRVLIIFSLNNNKNTFSTQNHYLLLFDSAVENRPPPPKSFSSTDLWLLKLTKLLLCADGLWGWLKKREKIGQKGEFFEYDWPLPTRGMSHISLSPPDPPRKTLHRKCSVLAESHTLLFEFFNYFRWGLCSQRTIFGFLAAGSYLFWYQGWCNESWVM